MNFVDVYDHEHESSNPVLYKRYHLVCDVEIYKKGLNACEINGGSSWNTLKLVANDCHNGVEVRRAIMLYTETTSVYVLHIVTKPSVNGET